jgi:CheY-like chemotaxis protein
VATVVVVEDHADTADLMARCIRSWGYRPLVAHSGEAALALLGVEAADLVIVDGMMPGMNGIEFIRLLRAGPATATIPAVLFTAVTDTRFHQNALQKGADECWIKGNLEYEQIKHRVDLLVARHHGLGKSEERTQPKPRV